MQAFFNEPQLKASIITRLEDHARLDEIIQGTYWQNGKGCAVGCTVHSDNHGAFERHLGIPMELAYLEEHIFERSTEVRAKSWPLDFIRAIPVGADLSLVWPTFAHWLLVDPQYGVIRFTEGHVEAATAIKTVGTLYGQILTGTRPSDKEFRAAARAARAAARAAEAAAEAAEAAAEAAEAAEAAAGAAAGAAEAAAWAAAIEAQREKLVSLLRACDTHCQPLFQSNAGPTNKACLNNLLLKEAP